MTSPEQPRSSEGRRSFPMGDGPLAGHSLGNNPLVLLRLVPDLILALTFLATWIAPTIIGTHNVSALMLVMLFEFISVHSSAFTGNVIGSDLSRPVKAVALLALGAFYSTFSGAFALAFRAWWPLFALWGLTLEKLIFVLFSEAPSEDQKAQLVAGWAISVFWYVAMAFATAFLPIPALGLTPAVREGLNLSGSGLWIDQPQRVLAFGFLYFTAISYTTFTLWRRGQRWA